MSKQKKGTKSSKRYRYSSFKDKIDSLRIEPARNLEKRVHDHVESSHFLSSFEHWTDVNMSADFSTFSDEIRAMVQTLPQILYHEEKLFEHLKEHINKHDERSLQPLLDLLAQFCHDLGPDFMKYYKSTVTMLTNLLDDAINFESSDVFEWGFTSLAYIFKYLSRILTQDLVPTFDLLFPLLSHPKDYLSRFSAEALSFLIRKSKSKSLSNFVSNSLQRLEQFPDENLNDGLRVLFVESLTTTSESLHSKSNVIMEVLLLESLNGVQSTVGVSLIADVLMDVLRHASKENAQSIYELILITIEKYLEEDKADLDKASKVILTLAFAESGRKIPDWLRLVASIQKITKYQDKSTLKPEITALLFATFIRNSSLPSLTQFHKTMFEFYMEQFPSHFLEFFRICLDLDKDRLLSFNGAKYLQKYINVHWAGNTKKIALFLFDLDNKIDLEDKLRISIPIPLFSSVMDSLNKLHGHSSDSDIYEVYWRLPIVKRSNEKNSKTIDPFIRSLISEEHQVTDFQKDVFGYLLQVLKVDEDYDSMGLIMLIINHFKTFQNCTLLVESLNKLIGELEDGKIAKFLSNNEQFLLDITDNLSLPNDKIRYESLKLIITILGVAGRTVPQIIYDCKVIEEIPHDLQNARDLTMRIRKMGSEFAKTDPDTLLSHIFIKCLFGLLTVRFSPLWEGVYEILPNIYGKNQSLVWSLLVKFLNALDYNFVLKYYEESILDDTRKPFWTVSVSRLNDSLKLSDQVFESYFFANTFLLERSKQRRGDLSFPGLIRNQTLKVLLLLPGLAERNSRDIIPFVFNQHDSEDVFEADDSNIELAHTASYWTDADRNLLLKLIGKFKNIKAIYKSEEVYERLLILLGSKTTEVQRLALDAILAYKEPVPVKYRDNLKNLLDDTLFKDEIIKLLSKGSERRVEDGDEEKLMSFILRILFGRAQTPLTSGIKKSRKTAVVTILPNLKEKYVIDFLRLGSGRFRYEYFFSGSLKVDSSELTISSLRKMIGFVNLVHTILPVLGSMFPNATETVINPLLYSMAAANETLATNQSDAFLNKLANNLRQSAMKCLYSLFNLAGRYLNWTEHVSNVYEIVVKQRLLHFEDENLQQPSSLLKIIAYWGSDKALYELLYYDNFASVVALMKTLNNSFAKESVIEAIINFSNGVIKNPVSDDRYVELISIIASTSLQVLPSLFRRLSNQTVISIAIDLLLNLTKSGCVQDNQTRSHLINSLTEALNKQLNSLHTKDRIKILESLASLIDDYDCAWNEIEDLYKACSRLYRVYSDRGVRTTLNGIFVSISSRFANVQRVAHLLSDLNSYSTGRIDSYDFERVLPAFKKINETDFENLTELEWLPILHCCLFYINDEEELAIRTNATHSLSRFVDYINLKPTAEDATAAVQLIEKEVLPHLRSGLRKPNEEIQAEYISAIAYIVTHSCYYTGLNDMKVLLFNGDEEANFFINIAHIQLHRRQRAIRRLSEYGSQLSENSISHYLIPMIEHYVFCSDEKYRNLGNETIITIGQLSNYASWNQYRALLRRYVSMIGSRPAFLKEIVSLIVEISKSLKNSMNSAREGDESKPCIRKFPKKLDEPETFIKDEIYVNLSKVLATRNEETIVARIPLSEALVNLILGLEYDGRISLLPGILTSVCQVLRSKSEELREAVRKNLSRIAVILGAEYLTFIIKELKTALKRGSQIHVLSYTIHHVILSLSGLLKHGDLDSSAQMIIDVVMEDTFGMAGQEKDAEGYKSKMKEVKFNKSYDTSEILASNVSLPIFGTALRPIKALLVQQLSLKTQHKLDELLRRYALGLNHNEESSSTDVLTLCYEVYMQSENASPQKPGLKNAHKQRSEKEEFFLINLNSRDGRVQSENSLFGATLQRFSLDLLRTVLSRNSNLLDSAYLSGFIPLLQNTLDSENEGVLVSTLRVLIIFVKLEFPSETEGLFKNCARKVLNIIKDTPSTSTELCQICLKYLSTVILHTDIQLKDTALSYVLGRIQPDLNEPNKQGLAFNFLKALLAKHIILPEMYDVVDVVAGIMITNHSKEIRDVSRSVYFQFLMEYDQSRGRLEKQFKFLVSNLEYPSQEGRQSVMELINLIVNKSNPDLLNRLASSFFLALANVSVNDDSPRCREMAVALITQLLQKLGPANVTNIEKYVHAWLKQEDNSMFINLGLRIYKIYLLTIGMSSNRDLHELAVNRTKMILSSTDVGSDSEWDLIYTALIIFTTYMDKSDEVFTKNFTKTWTSIVSCMLYPHPWVRLAAARLVNRLISNQEKLEEPLSDADIQTVAFRIFRQLGAPSLPEALSSISVKTLATIFMRWKENNTPFVATEELEAIKHKSAIDFAMSRTGFIIRNEDNLSEFFMSKKTCIQLLALMVQILEEQRLKETAEKIILPLFMYLESDGHGVDDQVHELQELSQECLQILESKLSVSDFTKAYAHVKQEVTRRRQERRARRAILAVTAPEAAANRKLKKHARSRQKRKHEKDENGYYRQKSKRRRA